MLSNYPPGVTGREYQIAGADWEEASRETCSVCLAICEDGSVSQTEANMFSLVEGTREYYQGGTRFSHVAFDGTTHTTEWEEAEPTDYTLDYRD